MLAGLASAGLLLGFALSMESTKACPEPDFDEQRFTRTFKDSRVVKQQGTCRLFLARHGLDGQQYLVQESLLRSAETLQASVQQSCEASDELRYITCWVEQGPASSIRLFSQFAISH